MAPSLTSGEASTEESYQILYEEELYQILYKEDSLLVNSRGVRIVFGFGGGFIFWSIVELFLGM